MQTQQATYLDFLGTEDTQMTIPVFQRLYTWGVWQCEELFDDICRANRNQRQHFIGSVVYLHEDAEEGDVCDLYSIIDGQQRTTTIFLLLIAIRDYLREHADASSILTADAIDERFLYVSTNAGRALKFTAAPADQETVEAILNKTPLPESFKLSKCAVDNYEFFMGKFNEGVSVDEVWQGLAFLYAIIVRLDDSDNPQLIFEGLNSKGMSLATSDLLRNKLFYGNDEDEQVRMLEDYWEPLEDLFADDVEQVVFHAAIRWWLVERDPAFEKFSRHELYGAFRKYLAESYEGTTEDLMGELLEACAQFKAQRKAPYMRKHMEWAMDDLKMVAVNKIFG